MYTRTADFVGGSGMMWWWGEEGRRGYTKVPSGEIPGASSVSSESESGSWCTGCERDIM